MGTATLEHKGHRVVAQTDHRGRGYRWRVECPTESQRAVVAYGKTLEEALERLTIEEKP